jgi:hypothetical protein
MTLTEDNKKTYKAIILLNELINGSHKFQTVANGDDKILEPLFIELMAKGYVSTSGINYIPTASGMEVFNNFMQRYAEYLKVYDVFSFVDLEKGEFAFARYFDFDSDEQWDAFKNDQRFDDLRIAVALFKKIDPAEIVFMSFINENRFDTQNDGWQMDLASDNTWAEIGAIVDTAIKPDEVGADAMEDMIRQGSDLMMDLLKEEQRQREEDIRNGQQQDEEVVYETVEYYEPYYDPWYVSPIWYVPLFLW